MQIERGLYVAPFANVFALVDGPGVSGLHQTREEAEAALKVEIERRASTEGRYGEHATNPVDGPDTGGEIQGSGIQGGKPAPADPDQAGDASADARRVPCRLRAGGRLLQKAQVLSSFTRI